MVIKTDVCAFSEYRIYPGHGARYVRRDGQLLIFINHKCIALQKNEKKKSAKLTWTQAWRRLNRKTTRLEKAARRRGARRVGAGSRAIAGTSAEDLRKRKAAPTKGVKTYAQLAAIREAKLRAKKAKTAAPAAAAPAAGKP